jgi:hypothetical protein
VFWGGGALLFFGVQYLVKASFECAHCEHVQWQGRDEFLRIGAWPATPVLEDRVSDFSSIARWWRHKYYGPPVSLESFLKEIEEEGVECGAQVWGYFWNRNFDYLEYG